MADVERLPKKSCRCAATAPGATIGSTCAWWESLQTARNEPGGSDALGPVVVVGGTVVVVAVVVVVTVVVVDDVLLVGDAEVVVEVGGVVVGVVEVGVVVEVGASDA